MYCYRTLYVFKVLIIPPHTKQLTTHNHKNEKLYSNKTILNNILSTYKYEPIRKTQSSISQVQTLFGAVSADKKRHTFIAYARSTTIYNNKYIYINMHIMCVIFPKRLRHKKQDKKRNVRNELNKSITSW